MNNGQPTGAQDRTTTEDGAYRLDGATSNAELCAVGRDVTARVCLPSEDEWYKAAYYDAVADVYHSFPTGSDSVPGYVTNGRTHSGDGSWFADGETDPGHYATYNGDGGTYGIGWPYYRSNVGEWENSPSPYGTFDQGGNVAEWIEAIPDEGRRGLRGGSHAVSETPMRSNTLSANNARHEDNDVGFRLVAIPDPVCGDGLIGRLEQCDDGNTADGDGCQGDCTLNRPMTWTHVGDPGNPGEMSGADAGGYGPSRVCGGVGHTYYISVFEVTVGQYAECLNAVAACDSYGLYRSGGGISRIGVPGRYHYSVPAIWMDRPVNLVDFGDALRFANWLHNGKPTGPQNLTTTEDGAYLLDGVTSATDLTAIVRKPFARVFLPTEDEWYKAAYYNGSVYYPYATGSDTAPGYVNNDGLLSGTGEPFADGITDPGNYANYNGDSGPPYGMGPPHYRNEVGEWENSPSFYGTFDQTGNVAEWTETSVDADSCIVRGGHYEHSGPATAASCRLTWSPISKNSKVGFRLAVTDNTLCGNGSIDWAEQCDDGNTIAGDGCDARCISEVCGNGVYQPLWGEECDDGNTIAGDGCDSVCILERCGDGILHAFLGELCDDGNTASGDGCDAHCQDETCGNGAVQPLLGEECDDGNTVAGDGCDDACIIEFCGDGIIQPLLGEVCDDANTVYEDGCSGVCAPEFCGDGVLQPLMDEACDDGNTSAGDGCNEVCVEEYCGDGITQPMLGEGCDDGGLVDGDGCDSKCHVEICGNGIVQPLMGEQCDDGNSVNADGCDTDCTLNYPIEWVHVSDAGNAGDVYGDDYGAVDHDYMIGKYEITTGQYAEFLNAVAATDTYQLYSHDMWDEELGCKIRRTGTSGDHLYAVATDWMNRPVNYVNWTDAVRFANWLHNGRPHGEQNEWTTEDGAYAILGQSDHEYVYALTRQPDARMFLPTEDEWYKAAYYDSDSGMYFSYPTGSAQPPNFVDNDGNLSNTGTPFTEGGIDPGGYATFDGDSGVEGIGPPYYRTNVGEWENSPGPYGTYDQGGNLHEWTETAGEFPDRCSRGGAFHSTHYLLSALYHSCSWFWAESAYRGFRVAAVLHYRCGDGVIQSDSETCDDGNFMAFDGCDTTCALEPGWDCVGEPSACVLPCTSHLDCALGASNACGWVRCGDDEPRICEPPIPNIYGDVCGTDYDLPPNGAVNLTDVLCTLNAFGVGNLPNCWNADVAAVSEDDCPHGNGVVNLTDVLKILDAFGAPSSPSASFLCRCLENP